MGFPMHPVFTRGALIGIMLGGGLLYAGISQAQDTDIQVERGSELVAAAGGPASSAHLIAFPNDAAAVEVRDDDVAQEPVISNRPLPASGSASHVQPTTTGSQPSVDAKQVAAADPAYSPN